MLKHPSKVYLGVDEKKHKEVWNFWSALHGTNGDMMTHLKGRVLTIIDAVLLNEQQCKATKDIIHQVWADATVRCNRIEQEVFNVVASAKYGKEAPELMDNPDLKKRYPMFEIEKKYRK